MNIKEKLPKIQENVFLSEHTTFKIGGPARYFFIAENKDDLIKAIKTAKELNSPFFILGNGSNVLFSDNSFNGIVIKLRFTIYDLRFTKLYTEAGVKLEDLARLAQENSLTGVEWLAGIPGTMGGAIYGNAQAFYKKISDSVESVEALDTDTLEIKNFSNKECQFSVKNSIFKKNKNLIILSAILKLEKGDREEIKKKVEELLKYRRDNHPLDFPSGGSVFINPVEKGKVIPAGFLIEKCGLKGKQIGNAQISEKHANFIVNLGGAKAQDVLNLIELAKQKVKEKFNIELKEEIQIIK